MHDRNYASTAAYFERRAAKAATQYRRAHFETLAKLYGTKARECGQFLAGAADDPPALSRRARVAAMFRAYRGEA
jgi:hypothetical protein